MRSTLLKAISRVIAASEKMKLYHGTNTKRLPSILKEGLNPKAQKASNGDDFVYLTDNPAVAALFSGFGTDSMGMSHEGYMAPLSGKSKNGVVLEVRVDPSLLEEDQIWAKELKELSGDGYKKIYDSILEDAERGNQIIDFYVEEELHELWKGSEPEEGEEYDPAELSSEWHEEATHNVVERMAKKEHAAALKEMKKFTAGKLYQYPAVVGPKDIVKVHKSAKYLTEDLNRMFGNELKLNDPFESTSEYSVEIVSHLLKELRGVSADFKTVEKKFSTETQQADEVKDYLSRFKKLKKDSKIKDVTEKDIDSWGKQGWVKFKAFVEELEGKKSKTEEKREARADGAELRAENEGWYVYKILNKDACITFGAGTRWCITDKQSSTFENYKKDNDFYFLIFKKMGKEKREEDRDPWYKIALQVNISGNKTYWDAQDVMHSTVPKKLRIPTFQIDEVEESIAINGKFYTLTEFQNLKNLKVNGDLDLKGFYKITSLPYGLEVGGDLNLRGTNITSLPSGLKVGGDLSLDGTKITSLPAALKVDGDLDLRDTKITSLPDGLKVGGSLKLQDTKITSLPVGLKVNGDLYLGGTNITSLPVGLEVGGSLFLNGTGITSLPAGLEVGEHLFLRGTPLAGKITSHPGVKGNIHS